MKKEEDYEVVISGIEIANARTVFDEHNHLRKEEPEEYDGISSFSLFSKCVQSYTVWNPPTCFFSFTKNGFRPNLISALKNHVKNWKTVKMSRFASIDWQTLLTVDTINKRSEQIDVCVFSV